MVGLTSEEKATIETYNKNARAWAKGHSYDWPDELLVFRKLIPKGKILELDCANGYVGKLLTDRGYDYVGTDVVPNFVKFAVKKYPGIKFLTKSVYDLKFRDDSFDGFWATAILLHISKDNIDIAMQEIRRVVKDRVVGFITLKEGRGEKTLTVKS